MKHACLGCTLWYCHSDQGWPLDRRPMTIGTNDRSFINQTFNQVKIVNQSFHQVSKQFMLNLVQKLYPPFNTCDEIVTTISAKRRNLSFTHSLTLCLPVWSADNFGKQFGPWSGPTIRQAWSGSKLFDILKVFLKEFLRKINFEKNQQTTKKHEKLPSMQWVQVQRNFHWRTWQFLLPKNLLHAHAVLILKVWVPSWLKLSKVCGFQF